MQVMQAQLTQLKSLEQQAEVLVKHGNPPGKAAVQKRLQDLQGLAEMLQDKSSSDNEKMRKQGERWQEYQDALQEVTEVLLTAERCLPVSVSHSIGNEDLLVKLNTAKVC